eukprot:Polyplicarium_translucidae@DN3047_c0_g1_i1.p1
MKLLRLYTIGVVSALELLILAETVIPMDHGGLPYQFKRLVLSREAARRRFSHLTSPLADLDYTGCAKSGRSYVALPERFPKLYCSGRALDLHASECLNDGLVSLPQGSEDFSSTFRKNPCEEQLHKCDEERWQLDVVIGCNDSLVRALESMEKNVTENDAKTTPPLKAIHVKAVSRIYGDHTAEILSLLSRNPKVAIPIVLKRLRRKRWEWLQARSVMESGVWLDAAVRHFFRSHDHATIGIKQADRFYCSASALVCDSLSSYYRARNLDMPPAARTQGERKSRPPSLWRGAAQMHSEAIPRCSLDYDLWSPELPPDHADHMPDAEIRGDVAALFLKACVSRCATGPHGGSVQTAFQMQQAGRIRNCLFNVILKQFFGDAREEHVPITSPSQQPAFDCPAAGTAVTPEGTRRSAKRDSIRPLAGLKPASHFTPACGSNRAVRLDASGRAVTASLVESPAALMDLRDGYDAAWDRYVRDNCSRRGARELRQWSADWRSGARLIWDWDTDPCSYAPSDGGGAGGRRGQVQVLFANDSLFVVMRLFVVVYHRLAEAKRLTALRRQPSGDRMDTNCMPWQQGDDHPEYRPTYREFVQRSCMRYLAGEMTQERFEDECRFALGNSGYFMTSLGSLAAAAAKSIVSAVSSDSLFARLACLRAVYARQQQGRPSPTIGARNMDPSHDSSDGVWLDRFRRHRIREFELAARSAIGAEHPAWLVVWDTSSSVIEMRCFCAEDFADSVDLPTTPPLAIKEPDGEELAEAIGGTPRRTGIEPLPEGAPPAAYNLSFDAGGKERVCIPLRFVPLDSPLAPILLRIALGDALTSAVPSPAPEEGPVDFQSAAAFAMLLAAQTGTSSPIDEARGGCSWFRSPAAELQSLVVTTTASQGENGAGRGDETGLSSTAMAVGGGVEASAFASDDDERQLHQQTWMPLPASEEGGGGDGRKEQPAARKRRQAASVTTQSEEGSDGERPRRTRKPSRRAAEALMQL